MHVRARCVLVVLCPRRTLEGEDSAASAPSDGHTVADGRGVQVIQGVSGFQVERKLSQRLFGVFDEETDFVLGRESLRTMRWMTRLSRCSRGTDRDAAVTLRMSSVRVP